MDQYCEKASLSLIKLGYGLTEKQSSALVPLSKSLGSPAPQTSLGMSPCLDSFDHGLICHTLFSVFELPDELILSILSHISPGPRFADHHARFRVQYSMEINNHRKLRARFLLPLSMTCKAMRFRFLPWIWEHVEPSWGNYVENLETIAYASCADVFLGTSVKYLCAPFSSQSVRADQSLVQVHDTARSVECGQISFLRQMPRVPPKSPHTRDRPGGYLY